MYRKAQSFGSVKWISLPMIRVLKQGQARGRQGECHEMVTLGSLHLQNITQFDLVKLDSNNKVRSVLPSITTHGLQH